MARRKYPHNSEAQIQPGHGHSSKDGVFETVAFAHRRKKNRTRNKLSKAARRKSRV